MAPFVPYRTLEADHLAPVLQLLATAGVSEALRPFSPVLAGTFPLGLDVGSSDADVLCSYAPSTFWPVARAAFSRRPGFSLHPTFQHGRAGAICRLRAGGLAIEIFAQAGPVTGQRGYRHLAVEHRLLSLGGVALRGAVMELRRTGLKAEPAFAMLLALPGDPYEAMLNLSFVPDAALAQRLRRIGFG